MNANNDSLFCMCNGIPMKESFVKIDPINKGFSGDKKYRVETDNGQVLMLRVSDVETYERKKPCTI